MKTSAEELSEKLIPLMGEASAHKILAFKGDNYLKVRSELLSAYVVCLLFYLLLKSKRKITSNHPVLDRLTQYKTLLEKMDVSIEEF